MRMEKHARTLAAAFMVVPAVVLLGGAVVVVSMTGEGRTVGELAALLTTPGFLTAMLWLELAVAAANLVAGVALLRERSWARRFGLVLGVLNLPFLPVGTAVGAYAIWVLSKEETTAAIAR